MDHDVPPAHGPHSGLQSTLGLPKCTLQMSWLKVLVRLSEGVWLSQDRSRKAGRQASPLFLTRLTGTVQLEHLKGSESRGQQAGVGNSVPHRYRMESTELCAVLVRSFLRMAAFQTREDREKALALTFQFCRRDSLLRVTSL